MRVLFDGYWWFTGPLANRSVQRDLITTWAADFPDDQLVIALRANGPDEPTDVPAGASVVRTRLWPHAASNVAELPVLARRMRADVAVVHNYTPATGRAATFIHDTMFVDHPEWFSLAERVYFWPMLVTARRAAAVFTSTRTESERIRRQTRGRLPVTAIGLGVPTALAESLPSRPSAAPEDGFALCVGRLNVRKNLAAVIRGAIASGSVGPEHPLLVVGSSKYSGRNAELPEEFRPATDDGSVRFLGRITDGELAWLYEHTSLVITLSLDEGFGLPAVEAALFGAPLVASDIPVFRETVGGYADFVDPRGSGSSVGAAIDGRWARAPSEEARAAVTSRYGWSAVVARLRAGLPA